MGSVLLANPLTARAPCGWTNQSWNSNMWV